MPEPLTSGGHVIGSGQLLVMSATDASIAAGGAYVTFDTILTRVGFGGVSVAGQSWGHPIRGVYVLTYVHAWDSFSAGGTIELELNGTVAADGLIGAGDDGPAGRGTIEYFADAGSVGKVKVTHSHAASQIADATLRVAVTDPVGADGGWTKVLTADVYDLTFDGANWWTTEGSSGVTVSKRDADWVEIATFEATAMNFVRGITFDGADLWLSGEVASGADEIIAEYSTAGAQIASYVTGAGTDGNHGLAWDGTHVWLVEDLADVAERYTTAGVIDTSFSLGAGSHTGAAWYENALYVVDSTNSVLLVFRSTGDLLGAIDISDAAANPTGAYIATDGTLYIAKDGDGVYKRTLPLGAI